MNKRNIIDFTVTIVFLAVCVFAFFNSIGGKGFWGFMVTIGLIGLFWMVLERFKKSN